MDLPVSPAGHRRYLEGMVCAFLLVIASWGLSDVIFSLRGPPPKLTITEMEYVEGMGFGMRRGMQSYASTINSEGFRSDKLLPRVPGELRILVLGDSVTFGVGLEQGEDWPAQLQRFLRARGVGATVMNGGTPGYGASSMLAMLKYHERRMKVDLVIVNATGTMVSSANPAHPDAFRQVRGDLFPQPDKLSPKVGCAPSEIPPAPKTGGVNVPTVLEYLSVHSPTMRAIVSLWPRDLAPVTPKGSSCDVDYFGQQGLGLAGMINFCSERELPIVVLKPFLAFNHAEVRQDPALLSRFLPAEFKSRPERLWSIVDEIDEFFDFFEKRSSSSERGRVLFIDPLVALRSNVHFLTPPTVEQLYLGDYVHLSVEGSKQYGEGIGRKLLERKIVVRTVQGELAHPLHEHNQSADLRWDELKRQTLWPALIDFLKACLVLSLLIIPAGLAIQHLLDRSAAVDLTIPLKGFFAVYAVILFSRNFVADGFYVLCALLVGVWCALMIQARQPGRRLEWRRVFSLATGSFLLSVIALLLLTLCVSLAGSKLQNAYVGKLQALAVWTHYESLEVSQRPTANDLHARTRGDGVERPVGLAQNLAAYGNNLNPVSPSVSAFGSRLAGSGKAGLGALLSESMMFSAALSLCAFSAVLRARGGKTRLALVAGAAVTALSVLWTPTPLACLVLAGGGSMVLASFVAQRWLKAGLYVAGGGIIYSLPAPQFVVSAVLVAGLAAIASRRADTSDSSSFAKPAMAGAFAMLALLAGRAFVFNLTVANAAMYAALDAMKVPRFFY